MQSVARGKGNVVNEGDHKDDPKGRRKKTNVTKPRERRASRREESTV